jgi:hypothetical protein
MQTMPLAANHYAQISQFLTILYYIPLLGLGFSAFAILMIFLGAI